MRVAASSHLGYESSLAILLRTDPYQFSFRLLYEFHVPSCLLGPHDIFRGVWVCDHHVCVCVTTCGTYNHALLACPGPHDIIRCVYVISSHVWHCWEQHLVCMCRLYVACKLSGTVLLGDINREVNCGREESQACLVWQPMQTSGLDIYTCHLKKGDLIISQVCMEYLLHRAQALVVICCMCASRASYYATRALVRAPILLCLCSFCYQGSRAMLSSGVIC